MAKITRVTQKLYGSTGPTGEFGVFGSLFSGSPTNTKDPATIQSLANFLYGLGQAVTAGRKPAMEDVNSLFLLAFQQIAYILQQGIPEWDSATTYYEHSMIQYEGIIYVSLQDTNLNQNPLTQPTYWGFPNGTVPTGAQLPYGGSTAPSGFLLCDGSAVSRTTYSRLFAITGTTYGVGDGSTTFNLPNKKGKVSVGLDASQTEFNTRAKTGGAKTHTLTISEMPAHTHTINMDQSNDGGTSGRAVNSNGAGADSTPSTSSTGGGGAHNNLQPYEVDLWIIKT